MSFVSTETDLSTGRWRQKQRTRQALIDAARELVTLGSAPTVENAAERAGISRTTAYRYFANQRSLLVAAHPETAASSLLSPDAPNDAAQRLQTVVERFTRLISDTEQQQRTMLRLSLELPDVERAALPLRQGRAIGWITEALEPLRGRLDDDQVHRLALAVRSATGIEALVWLTDVAALPRDEALALMRWSAQAMLRATLDDGPPPTGRRRRRRVSDARRAGHSGALASDPPTR
jgi:AcrR family transcriptional regulator